MSETTLSPLGNQARLYTLAAEVLRECGNDIAAAVPLFVTKMRESEFTLLTTLAGDYLNRVAADVRFSTRPKPTETITGPAFSPTATKMPTAAQRRGELIVAQSTSLFDSWKIKGRSIGNLYVHELRTLAEENVTSGFHTVVHGQKRIFNGAACQLITQHIVASNPMSQVRDVITAETLKQIERKAQAFTKRALDKARALSKETLQEIAAPVVQIEE